jgi:glycosyltransferase involved in cell wall biosynthesis
MRIAQVAPLFESVPPALYGGTERVVSYLTEELVALGHDVTLFASGDSRTSAVLVPVCPRSLRLDPRCVDHLACEVFLIERAAALAHRFDVIHFHTAHLHFPVLRRTPTSAVTTMHGRLDMPELVPLYDEFAEAALISISDAQRVPLPNANWVATIHHGLPVGAFSFHARPDGNYFAFLGRISREKRVDRAIAIAKALGVPLRIAAKVDRADRDYFESEIRPLLDHPLVTFLGEVREEDKDAFLGGARALLFPIDWPEPFGLVMIEALACGTPVVAFRCGSVPEIIEPGHTGFIVDTIEEAIAATRCVATIDRRACRQAFEQRFSARRMARQHEALYERLLDERTADGRCLAGS